MAYEPEWGVTVEEVAALAPHVHISPEVVPDPSPDPLYADRDVRAITEAAVEGWITSVSARVAGRLWRIADLPLEHAARAGIELTVHDVVANGAAAYLVDAAFPAKSAPNDNTSYGAVLWARYESGLAEVEARLVGILDAPVVTGPPGPVELSFEFPPPTFVDNFRY